MSSTGISAAGLAFDSIAEDYDRIFTCSVIGRAQRQAVWDVLSKTFVSGERVLELNCGTGEDALFMAQCGVTVTACDASARMIAVAKAKLSAATSKRVEFMRLRSEDVSALDTHAFDGVLSNFSGLNCVDNLREVAVQLAARTKPGARLVLCLSTRVCAWEIAYYSLRLDFTRALRRISGRAVKSFGSRRVEVHYPTVSHFCRTFEPWFRLRSLRAVGLFVPPSYLEHWAQSRPRTLSMLQKVDHLAAALPLFRVLGDHVLFVFERSEP